MRQEMAGGGDETQDRRFGRCEGVALWDRREARARMAEGGSGKAS